jgi:predicted exporter
MMAPRGRIIAVWLACVIGAAVVVARAHYVTDLSAFLPARPTPAQQLLVDQLRDGPASRLILLALEGGDAGDRARIARATARSLRQDSRFSNVADGEAISAQRDQAYLFEHRYLLSDAVSPARFTVAGLRAAIEETIDSLASSTGLMLKSLVTRDPTGEMLQLLEQVTPANGPQTRDGVWISADGARTLLVVQTAAAGSDTDAQERALDAIRAAFADALRLTAPRGAATARIDLRLSGPGVFAVAARAKIEGAAVRLSIISGILVVALLLAVYRSPIALLLGLLPVATGAVTGIAAVALGFGVVHGITLGFGITLIGESVDYSIYFFIQSRRRGDAAAGVNDARAWQTALWPTIRLGVLTSICGFASLLPSGFPGLAQLGLYSISGLLAAALVTRYLLPALLPRDFVIRDLTALGQAVARMLAPATRLSRPVVNAAAMSLATLALLTLYLHRDTLWNRELAALSPIRAADQDYDANLRADLGAAGVRALVIVQGPSLDAALRSAENAGVTLERLMDEKLIGGFDSPARYLPSAARQRARLASLPDPQRLRDDLRIATTGLALDSDDLSPFRDDVAAARSGALVTAADLRGTSLAAAFDALLLPQQQSWIALLPLHAVAGAPTADIDTQRVAAALAAANPGAATVLDLKTESDALYSSYLTEAIRLSLAGLACIVVLLLIVQRSAASVARILAPLLLAVLSVAAALALCGQRLTILHLVAMLLIVAIGSNYALFFEQHAVAADTTAPALTLASLLIANVSTVMAFGLLSFSQVPVLVALGTTVAPGAFLALLFAAILTRPPVAHAQPR